MLLQLWMILPGTIIRTNGTPLSLMHCSAATDGSSVYREVNAPQVDMPAAVSEGLLRWMLSLVQ